MNKSIKVRVPQTSANLGAGFDTLGLALSVYNYFTLTVTDTLDLTFTGCKEEYKNDKNLVYTSMKYILDKYNYKKNEGYFFEFDTVIKDSSGLGSSATCIVGGLLLGSYLLEQTGIEITKDEIVNLAIEIEGHGDNVVPAILGSLTVVMNSNGVDMVRKVPVSKKLSFATITSDLEKESTNKLRDALKQEVPLSDAVFNISHAVMATIALQNGDHELLKNAMEDRLHEDCRKTFIEDFDIIRNKALELNAISLNISGSGPSLLVIHNESFLKNEFIEFLKTQKNNWCYTECFVDEEGALIEEN